MDYLPQNLSSQEACLDYASLHPLPENAPGVRGVAEEMAAQWRTVGKVAARGARLAMRSLRKAAGALIRPVGERAPDVRVTPAVLAVADTVSYQGRHRASSNLRDVLTAPTMLLPNLQNVPVLGGGVAMDEQRAPITVTFMPVAA
ncbi:MAG TPA: hypothetical protein VLF43_00680 [Candidatus Saccharimonadales bacterium]|nr:hypothetical protein [Candidatus Saccharimonadales bacterium]